MKHINLFIASLVLCFCSTLQAKERVINQPPFCVRNTTSIEVNKVVVSDTATVVHFYAKYRPKNWIKISAGSYLKDNNGETYRLRSGIGITPGKEFWMPESGEAEFQLVFPPVNASATSIDFTEGEGEDMFSIWGIQLKGNKLPEQILPQEAVIHKPDAASLPEPIVQYGKATLKGKLLDYRPNMATTGTLLAWDNLKGDVAENTLNIQPDGSFSQEVSLMGTAPCIIYVNNIASIQFFMEPNKTTELYVNLRELSRKGSKYHSQDKPYGKSVYINGPLQVVAQELQDVPTKLSVQDEIYKNIAQLKDMDMNAFKDYILEISKQIQAKIDKLNFSTATQQLLNINNQLGTTSTIYSVANLLTSAAVEAKKITREEANEYYSNLRKQVPADFISAADLKILNSQQATLSNKYLNLAIPSLNKNVDLAKKWGTDKGIFFNLVQVTPMVQSIKDFTPLTNEQNASIENLPAAYREMLTADNNELLAQIEINKNKKGYTVNEIDSVSNEELFLSIINKYKGKVLLVDFWATWCGPCRMANKAMIPMKEDLKDKDIVYIYLTGETSPMGTWQNMIPDIHGEHFRMTDAQWKYLNQNFKIQGIPTYMVIDRRGETAFRATGFPGVDKMKEELMKVLAQ